MKKAFIPMTSNFTFRISYFLLFTFHFIFLISCTKLNVFEKNVTIPSHQWSSSFKPQIVFNITDTTATYNIYFVIRHTDAYPYKNIWINIGTTLPGDSTGSHQRLDVPLATDDKGWLGSGMDDIFEHRILIANNTPARSGNYIFTLQNIMRDDPLPAVMNVGIRVEKVK